MSIKICHASIDENKKISGGSLGDQTSKEVCIRTWYSKPWQYYIECTDDSLSDRAATLFEQIATSNKCGYDQTNRLSLYNGLVACSGDISKLPLCETDCSAAIAGIYKFLGLNVNQSCTTRNIRAALVATGKFVAYSDAQHLSSDSYAKRGGLFLKEGSHVVMALENGSLASPVVSNSVETKGIDVSSYQGNIDWNKVKSDGVQFAILKVMRKDSQPDTRFEEYWTGCTNANIPIVGVYNYSYATTVSKAEVDAKKVLRILNGRKTKVWLDVEDTCQKDLGQLLINIIKMYQAVILKAGYEFGVYTGLSFYNSYIKPYSGQLSCDFWIARYPSSAQMTLSQNPNADKKPSITHSLYAWQYSSRGKINGIEGNVDMNIMYSKVQSSTTPTIEDKSPISHFNNYVATKTSNLKVRKRVGNEFQETGSSLKKGIQVYGYGAYDGWIKIGGNKDDNRWCSSDYLSSNFKATIVCNALNFRDSDSTNGNKLCALKRGRVLKLFAQSNETGWVLTEYGWCSSKPEYIKIEQI